MTESEEAPRCRRSEVYARLLLALDGLEQSLEVALAESLTSLALDHLQKEGGAILDRAGEDLQQVAMLVTVDQDVQLAQPLQILVDGPNPIQQGLVVAVRGVQELGALVPQPVHAFDDVF